jgi:two-component system, LuxR family, response regulator FixJ
VIGPQPARTTGTVFVVDDDPSVRRSLQRLVKGAGWAVRTFASAEELLREELPPAGRACLIADVHLGNMSGLELQAALNTRAPHLPVILTSGLDNPELEMAACELGTVTFLRKPFEPGALLEWIRKALGEEASPSRVAV